MPLVPGARLGPFRITEALGAGGMGEVYRALDTRLDRHVALKLILEALVADPDRAMRFAREAKTLAAVNHPHIATLYGIEQIDGRHVLVMELVEGETLAERIAKYPTGLPLESALQIAGQIAEALEAAHEKGIVHRDLKPANVKITPDDKVKVLDFGLARMTERDGASSSADVANSPTMSLMGTQAGIILGTASYMSPEQARGYTADHRSDIFSFGVVLYEMLTGRQPFPGETISDVLASVLARDPDLGALPSDLSPRLIDLVKRCLEKNPKKRWQAIGDVRYELEALQSNPRAVPLALAVAAAAAVRPRPLWRRALPVAATAVVASVVVGSVSWFMRPISPDPPLTRFTITPPEGTQLADNGLQTIALSPAGDRIAYVADRQIYVRSMSQFDATAVLPTAAPSVIYNLAFSPDGESIAYWVSGGIMMVPASGGPPVAVVRGVTSSPYGLTWTGSWIVYAYQDKVVRVPSTGGAPEMLLTAAAGGVPWHPELLPDGKTVIYTLLHKGAAGTNGVGNGALMAQQIGATQPVTLLDAAADVRFVPPHHLVFARQGALFAVPFDPATLRLGRAVPVLEGVRRVGANAQFTIVPSGVLAYIRGPVENLSVLQQRSLVAVRRDGTREFLKPPPGNYSEPRVSPDGRMLAFVDGQTGDGNIWIYELKGTAAARRLTFSGKDRSPVWSADSTRITFQSEREGDAAIFWQRADGSGVAERLTKPDAGVRHIPMSWSPDGTALAYDAMKGHDVTLMIWRPRDRSSVPFGGVQSFAPTGAVFSPDSHWLAYSRHPADDAGVLDAVLVQPFPATGALFQISDEGHHPVWAKKGAELLYSPGGTAPEIVSVPLTLTPTFAAGESERHARNFTGYPAAASRPYDAAPDGTLYAMTSEPRDPKAASGQAPVRVNDIRVVLNWIEELKKKVPSPWR